MIRSVTTLIAMLAFLLSTGCHAQPTATSVPPDWKTECVGRYQVSVPGEVEVALISIKDMIHGELGDPNDTNRFKFVDGTVAPYSRGISATEQMDENSALEFSQKFKKMKGKYDGKAIYVEGEYAHWMPSAENNNNFDFTWIEPGYFLKYVYSNEHFFIFEGGNEKTGIPENDLNNALKRLKENLDHFHPRALFELPKTPGVCFPYGFISDSGKESRNIAVTMRLKEHQDIEVFFQDKSGLLSSGTRHEPKDDIEYFWTMMYRDFAKLLEADHRGYHDIQIGGQKGKGMFVTITRKDGSKDYGYIAIVKGDPEAATDTPSQMLYVIRTAARAKGKPVSKDELIDMAKTIAASIKPMATQ